MSCVEVVWVTPDAEKHLAYIARVSNPDNQETGDASKLIAYLIKHKHWSPFEMVSVCLEVNTARDIGRQALRHNPRVQEFSQRYQTVDKLDGFVYREFRKQDKKNRQKSIDVPEDDPRHLQWKAQQEKVIRACSEAYEWCIANGGAKEVARVVLPEGLTPTRMYFHGNLRDWIHYVEVRCDESTQKEHREIANAVKSKLVELFPTVASAMGWAHV